MREIARAKERFGLDQDARVITCYEAGRDGFWLDRYLEHHGIQNLIVDSSSIEVNRRARRAKCDSMDASKLLTRFVAGDHAGVAIKPKAFLRTCDLSHHGLDVASVDRALVGFSSQLRAERKPPLPPAELEVTT